MSTALAGRFNRPDPDLIRARHARPIKASNPATPQPSTGVKFDPVGRTITDSR
jgi:hypothetical protein